MIIEPYPVVYDVVRYENSNLEAEAEARPTLVDSCVAHQIATHQMQRFIFGTFDSLPVDVTSGHLADPSSVQIPPGTAHSANDLNVI